MFQQENWRKKEESKMTKESVEGNGRCFLGRQLEKFTEYLLDFNLIKNRKLENVHSTLRQHEQSMVSLIKPNSFIGL